MLDDRACGRDDDFYDPLLATIKLMRSALAFQMTPPFHLCQGWAERDVFGKIRYMNANGCRRKFDVDKYIARVDKLVADTKKPGNKLGATPVHVKKEEDGSA